MSTIADPPAIDTDKLMSFVFKAVDEVGATLNAALVVMGDKLGYYRDLAANGPTTPAQLAERTQTAEPYAREWLNAQAAGDYVTYDPATKRYTLPAEHALAMTDPDSAAVPARVLPDRPRHGPRHAAHHRRRAQRRRLRLAPARHRRARRVRAVLPPELPRQPRRLVDPRTRRRTGEARDRSARGRRRLRARGIHDPARAGVPELDVRGLGLSRGVHRDGARARRPRQGSTNARFEVASAQEFSGRGYDLVAMFDCLHDMGDPVGAARHVRDVIADDGTWMIVEPMAGDHVEDNLNPVGRAYYGFSTLLCTPSSLSQDVGLALGTQAGPARIHDVTTAGGFTRFRSVAETPFNRVIEARP